MRTCSLSWQGPLSQETHHFLVFLFCMLRTNNIASTPAGSIWKCKLLLDISFSKWGYTIVNSFYWLHLSHPLNQPLILHIILYAFGRISLYLFFLNTSSTIVFFMTHLKTFDRALNKQCWGLDNPLGHPDCIITRCESFLHRHNFYV